MSDSPLITLQEAASLLGVTAPTLRNWDKMGRLNPIRHPLNQYRMYRLDEVVALNPQENLFDAEIASKHMKESSEKPLTSSELRRLMKVLHRILRDEEGNSSLIERFDELSKVLFIKIHDERGALGKTSQVFLANPGADERQIGTRIREAFQYLVSNRPDVFPPRFSHINLQDSTIAKLADALAPLTLLVHSRSEDLKGLAFEELIKNTFDKGDNQQFFTPRPIVEFMIEFIAPFLGGTICDPACGTGGFLLSVAKRSIPEDGWRLLGFEIDERLAWATRMNLDMHGVRDFSVQSLSGSGSLGPDLRVHFESIDAVITNPPFGSDLANTDALTELELGRGRTSRRRGVLFIERCLDLLRNGGVAAIIIDDGVLNSPSNADVRRLILRRSEVLAIVSLPETSFMPYASVKSSILFLRRADRRNNSDSIQTFFAEAEVVGRKPNGEPLLRLNRTTGRLELDSDLPEVLRAWQVGRDLVDRLARVKVFWSELPSVDDPTYEQEGFRLDLAFHHPSRYESTRALESSPYPLATLADLCHERRETVIPSKEFQEEEITYLGLAGIEPYNGVCSPSIENGASLKSAVKRFLPGDVLFAKMRPELRKACVIPDDVEEGFASAECIVLIPKRDEATAEPVIMPELLSILLRSDLVYGQLVHQVIGIGRPRLSRDVVLGVRLPVLPRVEQERVLAAYHHSRGAAEKLVAKSERALGEAYKLMAEAGKQLVQDVLSNSGDYGGRA